MSKPRVRTDFQELLETVVGFLASTGEKASFGHGFDGWDIACYGSLTWRSANDPQTHHSAGHDVLVDLPGQALEFIRNTLGISDQQLCKFFRDLGFKAKRWDGAIDCTEKRVTPKFVYDQVAAECDLVCCEANKRTFIISDDIHDRDQIYGTTCYIGTRSSSRFMRIYDKVKEKLQKTGEILADEDGAEIAHLTRFEIECHDEAADFAMRSMAEIGVESVKAVMRGWIDFKDAASRGNCKRKHDAKRARWWENIVGDGVKLKPGLHRTSTPERTKKWLEDGVAASIALARKYGAGQELEQAISVAESKLSSVKEKQWKAYADHRVSYRRHLMLCALTEQEDSTSSCRGD